MKTKTKPSKKKSKSKVVMAPTELQLIDCWLKKYHKSDHCVILFDPSVVSLSMWDIKALLKKYNVAAYSNSHCVILPCSSKKKAAILLDECKKMWMRVCMWNADEGFVE